MTSPLYHTFGGGGAIPPKVNALEMAAVNFVRAFAMTKKPDAWGAVTKQIQLSMLNPRERALIDSLPVVTLPASYTCPAADDLPKKPAAVFIARTVEGTFLINTEGHDYCRYAAQLI